MAKATTSKSKMISLRVPIDDLVRWLGDAAKADISLAALICQRMNGATVAPQAQPPTRPAVVPRAAPLAQSVDAAAHRLKPVAAVLSVTGTDFPRRSATKRKA